MKKEEIKVSKDGRWILAGNRMYPSCILQKAIETPTGIILHFSDPKVNHYGEIIDRNSMTLIQVEGITLEELMEKFTDKKQGGRTGNKDTAPSYTCDKCGKERNTGTLDYEDGRVVFTCSICNVKDREHIGELTEEEFSDYLREKLKELHETEEDEEEE